MQSRTDWKLWQSMGNSLHHCKHSVLKPCFLSTPSLSLPWSNDCHVPLTHVSLCGSCSPSGDRTFSPQYYHIYVSMLSVSVPSLSVFLLSVYFILFFWIFQPSIKRLSYHPFCWHARIYCYLATASYRCYIFLLLTVTVLLRIDYHNKIIIIINNKKINRFVNKKSIPLQYLADNSSMV